MKFCVDIFSFCYVNNFWVFPMKTLTFTYLLIFKGRKIEIFTFSHVVPKMQMLNFSWGNPTIQVDSGNMNFENINFFNFFKYYRK